MKTQARRRLLETFAALAVLTSTGCPGGAKTYTATPGDAAKPARACRAVDEATPLAMSPTDRHECEATMGGWYAETWNPQADPADGYTGEAQLEYLRTKALSCRRAADAYNLTGEDRWRALMRCLVKENTSVDRYNLCQTILCIAGHYALQVAIERLDANSGHLEPAARLHPLLRRQPRTRADTRRGGANRNDCPMRAQRETLDLRATPNLIVPGHRKNAVWKWTWQSQLIDGSG